MDGQVTAQAGRRWEDQVVRRELFEAAHPDVTISLPGPGLPWLGVVPLPGGGQQTVTAPDLGRLLDQLDALPGPA
jgi:hypothetical protein